MRRLVSIASLAFLLSAILMVFAVPSFATEAEDHATDEMSEMEDAEHAEESDLMVEDHAEDASKEEGQWTGTVGSLVAGVLLAGLAFGMSGVAGLGEEDH